MWYTILCNFFEPEIFWNTSVLLLIFSVLWDKKVSAESRDLPLLAIKTFDKRSFSENWRSPLRNFTVLWENQFSTKSWYTILCNFFNPESFSNRRVTLGLFSLVWDKKGSRESRDIPLLPINFFDKRIFLKNEWFPYEVFRYCEKIIIRQICDTLSYAIFLNQKVSETQASPY